MLEVGWKLIIHSCTGVRANVRAIVGWSACTSLGDQGFLSREILGDMAGVEKGLRGDHAHAQHYEGTICTISRI